MRSSDPAPASEPFRPGRPDGADPVPIDTAEGRGRFFVAPAADPAAVLVLGHGAGGGVGATDLTILAEGLPDRGITVVRFEQPWRTAGAKVAVRPARLDAAWNDALGALTSGATSLPGVDPGLPVFFGGRSAGARVACRTAAEGPVSGAVTGVVCCAFPLHLPGRPERSRAAELLAPVVPRLVCQGERDAFGTADEIEAVLAAGVSGASEARTRPDVALVRIPGADHSMRLPRRPDRAVPFGPAELRGLLADRVGTFILGW